MSYSKEMKEKTSCIEDFKSNFLTLAGCLLFANIILKAWSEVKSEINQKLQDEQEQINNKDQDQDQESEPEYDKIDRID